MLRIMYGLVLVLLVAVTLCNGAPSPKHYLVEIKDDGSALKYKRRNDDSEAGADYFQANLWQSINNVNSRQQWQEDPNPTPDGQPVLVDRQPTNLNTLFRQT